MYMYVCVSTCMYYIITYSGIWLIIFVGLNFHSLGSSDNFVGLYFHGIPTLVTVNFSWIG